MPETAGQHDVASLLEFLRERDVPCPLCRYNLRGLTQAHCPECRQELRLTVGVTRPRFLWFLLAVAPCMFSGIAAGLLLIPLILQPLGGGGRPELALLALDGLGWLSLLVGLALVHQRFVFLRQEPRRQRMLAAIVWAAHVLAFFGFFGTVLILNGGP